MPQADHWTAGGAGEAKSTRGGWLRGLGWGLALGGLTLVLAGTPRAAAQDLSGAFSEAEGLAANFHAVWRNRSAAEYDWSRRTNRAVERARAEAAREAEIQRERAAAAEQAREQAIYEQRMRQENQANAWAGRGQANLAAANYQQAIDEFEQAERIWPDGANSQFSQAIQQALHDIAVVRQLHGLAAEARSDLRDVPSGASTLRAQGPGAMASADALRPAGPGISTQTEIRDSLAARAPGAIQTRPDFGNSPGARYESKGWDAIVLHDYAVAIAWYEMAQMHDPGNVNIANMVGLLKELEKKDGDPYSYFSGAGVRLPPRGTKAAPPPSTRASQEAKQLLKIFADSSFQESQMDYELEHIGENIARENARRGGAAH